jgi:hypothetical protein
VGFITTEVVLFGKIGLKMRFAETVKIPFEKFY